MEERQRVAGLQWGWAVAAAVAAGLVVPIGFLIAPLLAGLFVFSAAPVAIPLSMRGLPKEFGTACLLVGAVLLAWSLLGAGVGMFLFIPAALLLFIAAFSGPGNRPRAWLAVTAPLVVAAIVVLFYAQPPDPDNEPPPQFQATLDSSHIRDREFNERVRHLRDFGAKYAGVGEHANGRFVLTVDMPDHFAEGQSQDRLKEEILKFPEVVELRLCTFHTCN